MKKTLSIIMFEVALFILIAIVEPYDPFYIFVMTNGVLVTGFTLLFFAIRFLSYFFSLIQGGDK